MNVHNLQIDDTHYIRASELEDGSFELVVVKHVRDTSDFFIRFNYFNHIYQYK